MNVKLLNIDIYLDENVDVNIDIKYGKILDNKDFEKLKNQVYDIKNKILKIIKKEFE